MHLLRTVLTSVALAAILSGGTTRADDALTFPSVSGRDLNGRALQLPKDLAGDVDLLFVAFVRGQQTDVDSWKSFADAAQKSRPNLKVYELPVLSRGISLIRGFIDGGMRNAIKAEAARAATITLYIDKQPFRRALGIENENHIAVLLIRRDGRVLWKGSGRYDPAKAPDLDALLK